MVFFRNILTAAFVAVTQHELTVYDISENEHLWHEQRVRKTLW
jgi:hypothetical protein